MGRVLLRDGDVITAGDSAFLVRFIEDSQEALNFATCAGCGGRIPVGATASRSEIEILSTAGQRDVWLCEQLPGQPAQVSQNASRLSDRGMDRRRGHGRGLSRPAALAQAAGRHQDDQRQ